MFAKTHFWAICSFLNLEWGGEGKNNMEYMGSKIIVKEWRRFTWIGKRVCLGFWSFIVIFWRVSIVGCRIATNCRNCKGLSMSTTDFFYWWLTLFFIFCPITAKVWRWAPNNASANLAILLSNWITAFFRNFVCLCKEWVQLRIRCEFRCKNTLPNASTSSSKLSLGLRGQ